MVSEFVASSLDLRRPIRQADSAGRREIGIVFGDKRSQMLCLEASDTLALVAGNNMVPLVDFIELQQRAHSPLLAAGSFNLTMARICLMLLRSDGWSNR